MKADERYQHFEMAAARVVAAPGSVLDRKLAVLAGLLQPVRRRALDVGANEGAVSIWLAQRGYQVDALELDPFLYTKLMTNVSEFWSGVPHYQASRAAPAILGSPVQPYQREADILGRTYDLILSLSVAHHQWRVMRNADVDGYCAVADWYTARATPGTRLLLELPGRGDPTLDKIPVFDPIGLIHELCARGWNWEPLTLRQTFSETRWLYVLELLGSPHSDNAIPQPTADGTSGTT